MAQPVKKRNYLFNRYLNMKKYTRPRIVKINVDKNLSLFMDSNPPLDPNGPSPTTPPGIVGKAIKFLIR